MATIDILMSTYNPNLQYFTLCLDSIQNQTFKDFRLVLVDDGTTNCNLEDVLGNYTFDYQIIRNVTNLGLPASLNKGLSFCNSEYIARMDDDDIMTEDRLEKELQFAKTHDGIIFSRAKQIDVEGNEIPFSDLEINIEKYLKKSGNCLVHSTLFVKKSILDDVGGYNTKFTYAQDYELYTRLLGRVVFYRMKDQLLYYRVQNNTNLTKRVLSLLYCYGAAVIYFSRHKSLMNTIYYFRRSLSLMKVFYILIKRS